MDWTKPSSWLAIAVLVLSLVLPVFGQGDRGKAELKITSGVVSVDYGRPSLKGRDMLSQLKSGDIWRMGMNQAAVFSSPSDLSFGSTSLAKGDYSVWLQKTSDGFQIIFNSQTGQWGTQHDLAKDVASVPLTAETLSTPVEIFTIALSGSGKGGQVSLSWGTTKLSAAFAVK